MKYPAYLLSLVLLVGGIIGCGPTPPVVNPPTPPPVVKPDQVAKTIIVFYESGDKTPRQSLLFNALRFGEPARQLEQAKCSLRIVDVTVDTDAKDPALVQYENALQGMRLPALFVLGPKGELLSKQDCPGTAGEIISLTAANHAEMNFGSRPCVDCDFSTCREFIRGYSEEEDDDAGKLDIDPRDIPFGAVDADGEPVFEAVVPLIPRSEWDGWINEIDAAGGGLDALVTRIYDQGREPSCTSNATCQAHEIIQNFTFGKVTHLSAISLYVRVGSPRSGSSVSGNLKELCNRGVLPVNNPENTALYSIVWPATGYKQLPNGWESVAKNFRGHEYYEVTSYDGFITALLKGYPVVYGRSGHAICAVRPVRRNGTLYVKYANSWHESWGDHGFGYDSERMVRSGASWAFALRSIRTPQHMTTFANDHYSQPAEASYALAP
jgi:hypothetical protein